MEFYGLLGEKLSHSLSPEIHKLILKHINEEGSYKLFEIKEEALEDFIKSIKLLKVKGCNVTIPYKTDIMKYLDSISGEAKRIGAINTISLVDNKVYGYNTDYYGFGYMLHYHKVETKGKIAVILGNGGACKACANYLLDNEISKVYVVSRKDIVNNIFNDCRIELINYKDLENIKGDILINSTPIGMYPNTGQSPVGDCIIKNFSVIVDLIYNPKETELMITGKKLSKEVVGGLFMLVGQAVKAQEIWHDIAIDNDIIEKIFIEVGNLFS